MLTWINDLFRSLMSLLDRMVYWAIELLVYLFNEIANVNLFGKDDSIVQSISKRIYILIAIIMIFKVSFSIIQYIINPDTFTDKERGMGKIIQNVVITLVCLVSVTTIFELAYDLQKRIVKSHVIESLVLGIDKISVSKEEQENISNQIPFTILSSFITPNTTYVSNFRLVDDEYICNNNKDYGVCDEESQSCYNVKPGSSNKYYDSKSYFETGFIECINDITKEGTYDSTTVTDSKGETHVLKDVKSGNIYAAAYDFNNYNLLLDIINHKWTGNSDVYLFEYKFIISTIVGVFVAIIYLNFCLDLAVRTVKLAFLQLIAPIPIISMIDPKSSKDGMMSKWVKNCISTYIGLFIRIAAVNFVVLIISLMSTGYIDMGSNPFVKLFIIFGAMMFAKELPKLISDFTGADLGGNFKMNPLSRMPIAGKAITQTGKAAGNIGAGALRAAGHLGFGVASTGGAALGSLVQAGIGAAKGQGWNYNSDRVKRELSLMGHREANSAINMLNKAGSNMASIVGAKPRGIPNGGDRKPSANKEFKKMEKDLKWGEELYNRQKSGENIYSNIEFSEGVQNYKEAKNAKVAAELEYNRLQTMANNGDQQALARLGEAGKRKADAEAAYNRQKEYFDKLCATPKNAENAKKYNALKAYKDLHPELSSTTNQQSPNYMNELINDRSVASPPANGTMDSVTPPSRGGNGNNNNP